MQFLPPHSSHASPPCCCYHPLHQTLFSSSTLNNFFIFFEYRVSFSWNMFLLIVSVLAPFYHCDLFECPFFREGKADHCTSVDLCNCPPPWHFPLLLHCFTFIHYLHHNLNTHSTKVTGISPLAHLSTIKTDAAMIKLAKTNFSSQFTLNSQKFYK